MAGSSRCRQGNLNFNLLNNAEAIGHIEEGAKMLFVADHFNTAPGWHICV